MAAAAEVLTGDRRIDEARRSSFMIRNGHISRWLGPQRIDTPTPVDRELGKQIPDPIGWFGLAFSDEVGPGQVFTSRFLDEDVVLYRTRAGVLRAVRPYCPHLGAHLGLGRVEGEDLVCAFHAFGYGPDGACVRTGYGTKPPRIGLQRLTVRENASGMILVWYHPEGKPPDWEVPDLPTEGFTPWAHATIDAIGHPQELMENPIDFGHFGTYHEMGDAIDGSVSFEPHRYTAKLRVKPFATFEIKPRPGVRLPLPRRLRDMTLVVHVTTHGVGLVLGDMFLPGGRQLLRVLALPSVQADGRMRIRLGAAVVRPDSWPTLLRPFRDRLLGAGARLTLRLILDFSFNEDRTGSDIPIWATKKYVTHPPVAEGDGPLSEYRRWARQFYPAVPRAERVNPTAAADDPREGARR
ncbi:Rieske 2Fe-2S domain-containing protein [Kitasatospora putterlickiae]|uniref:Rieske-type oxygenase n=2 Tax=Kitasatospora putterlickiae TaxID=221725 RepID=A0ABP4IGZ0_9ACTN